MLLLSDIVCPRSKLTPAGLSFCDLNIAGNHALKVQFQILNMPAAERLYSVADSRWISCNIDGRFLGEFSACFC